MKCAYCQMELPEPGMDHYILTHECGPACLTCVKRLKLKIVELRKP